MPCLRSGYGGDFSSHTYDRFVGRMPARGICLCNDGHYPGRCGDYDDSDEYHLQEIAGDKLPFWNAGKAASLLSKKGASLFTLHSEAGVSVQQKKVIAVPENQTLLFHIRQGAGEGGSVDRQVLRHLFPAHIHGKAGQKLCQILLKNR